MREIKFRAWDEENKSWIYSTHLMGMMTWFWKMDEEKRYEYIKVARW